MIAAAQAVPAEQLPEPAERHEDGPGLTMVVSLLAAALAHCCAQHKVAAGARRLDERSEGPDPLARPGPPGAEPPPAGHAAGATRSAARPSSTSSPAGAPSASSTPQADVPVALEPRDPTTGSLGFERSLDHLDGAAMKRIVSCFTNCYGADGRLDRGRSSSGRPGLDHLELALRGHNFGGLVIPESAVITEKADDAAAQAFLDHLAEARRQGQRLQRRRGRTSGRREGLELTQRRIRFAARWFGVSIVVSGAGQPADAAERRIDGRAPAPARRHRRRARDDRRPRDPQGPDPERRRPCSP